MWVTVDGERRLGKAEARLLCRGILPMLADCVAVLEQPVDGVRESRIYGIDWFDQWEAEQKVWLLEQVATALLTDQPSLKPAAMLEATVDAIFQHIFECVMGEVDPAGSDSEIVDTKIAAGDRSWCDDVIKALEQQQNRAVCFERSGDQRLVWRRLVMQIPDRILGVASYHTAESLRDAQPAKIEVFLQQKGLPADFFTRIPPLVQRQDADDSVARLHILLKQFGPAA